MEEGGVGLIEGRFEGEEQVPPGRTAEQGRRPREGGDWTLLLKGTVGAKLIVGVKGLILPWGRIYGEGTPSDQVGPHKKLG